MKKNSIFMMACWLTAISSCTAVKEYQKSRLNDSEMELSARRVQKTEIDFQSIREGASEPVVVKQVEAAVVIKQ